MKRAYIYIIGVLLLLLQSSCHHSSSFVSEDVELVLQRPNNTNYSSGSSSDSIELLIVCNAAWTVETEADWLHLSDTEGFGSGSIFAYVEANTFSSPRNAEIRVSLKQQKGKSFAYDVQQDGYTSLLSLPGYEKGAGFAYDIRADYCQGMTWQIFDVQALDYYQYQLDSATGAAFRYGTLVTDNCEAYSEDQVVAGSTLDEVNHQLSASASIDLGVVIASVQVSGNVQLKEWEKLETVYGVKRSKRIVFVRDIQYANCVAAAKGGQTGVFTPAFYLDWKKLEDCNPVGATEAQCNQFIKKWGVAFVCRSCMGGSFDFEMEIEKSSLGSNITVEAALDAEVLGGVLNAKGNVEWHDIHEQIKNSYSADLHVYGGDVQLISILTSSDSVSTDDFDRWVNSITPGFDCNNSANNNAVLVDVKIASIANLFTGNTRRTMEKIISNYVQL